MKANAPEKIYVHKSQYWGLMANKCITTEDDIEYTRTDAFIEKAYQWLYDNLHWADPSDFLENFKKYMEN